jgi:hypothetical protein
MIPIIELSEFTEELRQIHAVKDNLKQLKDLNFIGQKIMMITGIKLGEIYQEEDRITREKRELSFNYDREPFRKLGEELKGNI